MSGSWNFRILWSQLPSRCSVQPLVFCFLKNPSFPYIRKPRFFWSSSFHFFTYSTLIYIFLEIYCYPPSRLVQTTLWFCLTSIYLHFSLTIEFLILPCRYFYETSPGIHLSYQWLFIIVLANFQLHNYITGLFTFVWYWQSHWSRGQHVWLLTMRSRVPFQAFPQF